jgi:hypothetical protein
MILGFTGTSFGMTQRQAACVDHVFVELLLTELHHGWCVGADAEAHKLARRMQVRIVGHPPTDTKMQASLPLADFADIKMPFAYLTRNRHIVRDGVDGLIAAPKDYVMPTNLRGHGTWTTVGYAREAGRRIWIVTPDGTCREEQP